jgi:hypothetical protein
VRGIVAGTWLPYTENLDSLTVSANKEGDNVCYFDVCARNLQFFDTPGTFDLLKLMASVGPKSRAVSR